MIPREPLHSLLPYAARYTFADDTAAMEAGARIAAGETTRANVGTIFEWKTRGRGRTRLQRNSDDEIADALALAIQAKTERSAIAVLRGLNGVGIPVASAILTVIDPVRYTIIDFRTLWSLSADETAYSTELYLRYLAVCRQLAEEGKVSLRTLDRALWQYSYERQPTSHE